MMRAWALTRESPKKDWGTTAGLLLSKASQGSWSLIEYLGVTRVYDLLTFCFTVFSFTPDFTMSRVTRRLEIKTTFGPTMEFTLVATIPPYILPLCAAAMGRSSWEPVLQVLTVVIMVSVFIAVIVAAYSEARSILGISLPTTNLLLNCEERGQVFDLKTITGVKPK